MNTHNEPSSPSSGKPPQFKLPWPDCPPRGPSYIPKVPSETSSNRIKILVAEDDAICRELICARLTKWGFEVVVTQSGSEAMMALRKKDAPSLAILDWMMPGMDGIEICRRVREADRLLYIIMLTARGSKENLIEGLRAGADDYLVKPFDKDELHARILVGLRLITLQSSLVERLKELEFVSGELRELKSKHLM